MDQKEKRKKMTNLILDTLKIIDPSLYNYNLYKEKYEKMNDKQFFDHMKEFLNNDDENFYLQFTPFDSKNDLKLDNIMAAGKHLGTEMDEYIYLPYANPDGKPIRTKYKVPVGYLHVKRLQQVLSKKNSFGIDINNRNAKTGQVAYSDKNGRVSDSENFALISTEQTEALKEFFGPRADDLKAKEIMLKEINKKGFVSQQELPNDVNNKQSLKYLDVYFLGAGFKTDLLSNDLVLNSTLSKKADKERLKDKYERF